MNEEELMKGAEEWLAAAKENLAAGRFHTAFESARQAAELAAKALLSRKSGKYPSDHMVAGPLFQAGLLPEGVDGKRLHKLLSRFTLGTYGFDETVHRSEVQDAVRLAERMVKALRAAGKK
ncbi:MAG: HEPN domain-containing protein [Euryarchaeota archaeon]|nr:HEPN domain-containing protein [Euryarchaeota archaeon]